MAAQLPDTLSTATTFQRLMGHDPTLMAGLRQGDPAVTRAVGRVLRLTSLRRLATDPAALVAALAALPQLRPTLLSAWRREDPILTGHLLTWAEQACRHHSLVPAVHGAAA
ncbi:hypothetical protein [Pseudomonas sp.]|uniref:hypothetical protein n=1 Tax=Pseudomonas sp. TaxID=306 RepID=UPI002C4B16E0|nr:hypothetical protein [Pseudomonas sp.]HUE90472.1 hypothetical protein [Pseudomonas sp.]